MIARSVNTPRDDKGANIRRQDDTATATGFVRLPLVHLFRCAMTCLSRQASRYIYLIFCVSTSPYVNISVRQPLRPSIRLFICLWPCRPASLLYICYKLVGRAARETNRHLTPHYSDREILIQSKKCYLNRRKVPLSSAVRISIICRGYLIATSKKQRTKRPVLERPQIKSVLRTRGQRAKDEVYELFNHPSTGIRPLTSI